MFNYIVRRLILLPITLFFIVLVNFVIINLAPGEPTSITEVSPEGMATRKEGRSAAFGSDERYLQFREYYGLTLPILFNTWPSITKEEVDKTLWILVHKKANPETNEEYSGKGYNDLRIGFGDRARFIMPILLQIIEDPHTDEETRRMAVQFFIRGGTRIAYLGPDISVEQRTMNKKIAEDNTFLRSLTLLPTDTKAETEKKISDMRNWYQENKKLYNFEPTFSQKVNIFFF